MIHELRITITRWSLRFIQYRVHTVLYFLRISWSLVKWSEIVPFRFQPLFFFLICPLVNKAEAGNYLTFIRFRGESMSLIRKEARMELKSVHYGTWCRASDSCCTFFDIPGIHPFLSSLACLLHRVCRLSTGLGYARPSRFCRLSSCRDQDGRRFEGLLSVQLAFLRNE